MDNSNIIVLQIIESLNSEQVLKSSLISYEAKLLSACSYPLPLVGIGLEEIVQTPAKDPELRRQWP